MNKEQLLIVVVISVVLACLSTAGIILGFPNYLVEPLLWIVVVLVLILFVSSGSNWRGGTQIDDIFAKGRENLLRKEYEQGVRNFDTVLAKLKRMSLWRSDYVAATAHESRGYCHYHLGHYADAIADLTIAIESNQSLPTLPNIYEYRGLAQFELKDYEAAIADYRKALELSPRNDGIYRRLADLYYRLGEFDNAVKYYTYALMARETIDDYQYRGSAYYMLERYPDALKDFSHIIDCFSNGDLPLKYGEAYVYRGFIRYEVGESEGALADLAKAVELDPSASRYTAQAVIQCRLGLKSEALTSLNESLKRVPGNAIAYATRGSIRHELDDSGGALEDLAQSIALEPSSITYRMQAEIQCQLGLQTDALASLAAALKLDPEYVDAYTSRGIVRFFQGDRNGALADFMEAATLQPSASNYYNQAIAQYELGLESEAITSLENALSESEPYAPVWYFLGTLRYDVGAEEEAIAHFQAARALESKQTEQSVNPLHEQDIHGFYYRGLARYRMGNREEAISDLEKANTLCRTLNYESFQSKIIDLLNEISSVR